MTTYPADYCPDCGAGLGSRHVDGRDRRWCSACDRVVWHTPVPAAGVAVVAEDGVLLVRRAIDPGRGTWSIPGGHLEADEPPAVAAARELREETGVVVEPEALTLLDTFFSDHGDGKRVVSIGYVVPEAQTTGEAKPCQEVSDVDWVTPETVGTDGVEFLGTHEHRFETAWEWFRAA